MKTSKIVLLGGFILVILFPLINNQINITRNINTEKTTNVKKPSFNLLKLEAWINNYDTYYKKNFSGRSYFFKIISNFKYNVLGASILPDKVISGKDGFLFLGNAKGKTIENSLNITPFSKQDLNNVKKRINHYADWLKERDIKFYVTIAPNKSSIYKDYLPFKARTSYTRINQLIDLKGFNCPLIYLDPRNNERSDSSLLYVKKNTHWNQLGALYGYNKLIDKMKLDFPHLENLSLNDYKLKNINSTREDLSLMLDLNIKDKKLILTQTKGKIKHTLLPKQLQKPPKSNKNYEIRYQNEVSGKKLKVLVFGDSFLNHLKPYFNRHFYETIFIWHPKIDKAIIEKEKPDIVVFEVVERHLYQIGNLTID